MKLKSVQSLRAVAALAVVMCHLYAVEYRNSEASTILTDVWITGAGGVDLFFVISGFIMVWVAGQMPSGVKSSGKFLFARITRIYPLWWLFAGLMAAYFFVTYGAPWDADRVTRMGISGETHLLHSFLLIPQPGHPVLGVGWTLVHEMYFYAGFALLLLVLPARFRLYGLLAWGGLVIAGSMAGLSKPHAGSFVELIFYPMTFEFVLGALVAYAIQAGWRRFAWVATIVGTLSLIALFFVFDFRTGGLLLSPLGLEHPNLFTLGWGRTLCIGLPAAILLYGLVALELQNKIKIPNAMVHLGDWSYALYLSHILVLSAVARVYYGLVEDIGLLDNAGFILLGLIACITASGLTYHLFEKPLLGLFRHLRKALFNSPSTSNS